ncbi:sulfatase-like hydrolase/transferase [Rhodobacteraceae bacterium KMM 6894]|nr:sulfatase-like hydrolase/transferase [Rhodobacteraceae bacterium KMM 6894]
MTRPNIVVIMADQLAPQFAGAYGHGVAKTPHLDALAARGMRFDAANCNAPLCAPSRFAFMSGQLISRIAAWDNASEFKASIPTFAHYMKSLGYRTCLPGKMHFFGPDQMHGFQDRVTTDIYPADFAWTPDWEAPDERIDKWYHNMQTVKESGVAMATYQIDYDDEVGFAANRWLMDRARDRADGIDDPFLMVASFIHPHDPYVARPEWWDLYDDADSDMPAFVPPLEDLDPFSRRVMDGIKASYVPLSTAQVRRARRAYLANDPAHANTRDAFAAEVTLRWDSAALRSNIIATQKSRRALLAAMEAGASEPWDYNPPSNASQKYVRNHMDWTVAATRYRYPH